VERATLLEHPGRLGGGKEVRKGEVSGTTTGTRSAEVQNSHSSSRSEGKEKQGKKRKRQERQEGTANDTGTSKALVPHIGNSGLLPPAPRVPRELYQERRNKHNCIRCGSSNHRAQFCDKFGPFQSGSPEQGQNTSEKKMRQIEPAPNNQSKN